MNYATGNDKLYARMHIRDSGIRVVCKINIRALSNNAILLVYSFSNIFRYFDTIALLIFLLQFLSILQPSTSYKISLPGGM